MNLRMIDLTVMIIYLVGVVAFGSYFVRRSRHTEGFMVANRSLPGIVVGLSILGTYVSSISFLALPGNAFGGDWNRFVFSLSLPIAAIIAVKYFVPFYRKTGEISAYHHLEGRFGPWARTYALIMYLLTQLARMGTIMYLVALVLAPLTGVDIRLIIVITGVLVTIYTILGGIEAVIWTDAVQTVVLIGGALICMILMLIGMPEGSGQVFDVAFRYDKFSLGSFDLDLTRSTFWVVLVYGLMINLQNFGIDQNYVQRYITARSDQAAKRSVWIGALMYLPVSALFFFIGTALFAFYSKQPELLNASINPMETPDKVFPYFIVTQLPAGGTGLLIAAIAAAAMSTVDTSLNSSATLILRDIYKRYFRPQARERESMRVLYSATLFWGFLGTGIALAMVNVRSALDVWWEMAGIFSGGMLGLFLLGLISRKARNPAAITGVVTGILLILWMTVSKNWSGALASLRSPFHNFMIIVIGTLAILLVGFLVTSLRGKTTKPDSQVESTTGTEDTP